MLAYVRGQVEFVAFHNNPIGLHELQWLARMYEYPASGLINSTAIAGKKMAGSTDPAEVNNVSNRERTLP
jgi:hypothetical protein